MALSWAYKRRLEYGGGLVLLVALMAVGLFYAFFYKAPTCFDGRQNGGETGVDCGGSCVALCSNQTVTPVVLWAKTFNISGNVYNAVAYVNNPNTDSRNPSASYVFRIYDSNNTLLDSRTGVISIPKNSKFAVFEPGFVFKNNKPKYVEFEFTSLGEWQKDSSLPPDLSVTYSPLLSTSTSPRIEGTIVNNSQDDISGVELVTFVLDGNENVVAASRTFVDNLAKKTSQDFVFTWPKPFDLGVETCAETLDLAILLDRSGSMRSESKDPPEPFGTVKVTAKNFVGTLSDADMASVISFGDRGVVENPLSSDKTAVQTTIDRMEMSTSSEQTNITDGLEQASKQLFSGQNDSNKKVIVLLTDGVPTLPLSSSSPDYPKISAETLAKKLRDSGAAIYTIGLGPKVAEGFLKDLSGDSNHYFFAPSKETLAGIYGTIGARLCEKRPNAVTVMYRIP